MDEIELATRDPSDQSFVSTEAMGDARDIVHHALATLHIVPIVSPGGVFDPQMHELVFAEASTEPVGTILKELSPGYRNNVRGEIVRNAKVIVSGGPGYAG